MRTGKKLEIDKEELRRRMKNVTSKAEFQRLQCLWMREVRPDLKAKDIAAMVSVSVSSVWRIHAEALKSKNMDMFRDKRGGRYRENISLKEEETILESFLKKSETGGVIVVSEIKNAYEAKVGHKVAKSTVYRMLDRHGWRKIVPYKRNPKSDIGQQAEFKKNFRNGR